MGVFSEHPSSSLRVDSLYGLYGYLIVQNCSDNCLANFCKNVLYNEREVYTKDNVTYMPIYLILCMERTEIGKQMWQMEHVC